MKHPAIKNQSILRDLHSCTLQSALLVSVLRGSCSLNSNTGELWETWFFFSFTVSFPSPLLPPLGPSHLILLLMLSWLDWHALKGHRLLWSVTQTKDRHNLGAFFFPSVYLAVLERQQHDDGGEGSSPSLSRLILDWGRYYIKSSCKGHWAESQKKVLTKDLPAISNHKKNKILTSSSWDFWKQSQARNEGSKRLN